MDGAQSLDAQADFKPGTLVYKFVTGWDKGISPTPGARLFEVTIKATSSIQALKLVSNTQGAQYLDVSSLGYAYKSVRLNTLFGKELIRRASVSLDQVIDWTTQEMPEPPMEDPNAKNLKMDFHGANGLYFWELFFYLPYLVAWRLNLEQRHQESTDWLHTIFNPLDPGTPDGKPPYWSVRPLVEEGSQSSRLVQPDDPDGIAASDPVHYRKAVFLRYVQTLQDRGDAAYRELTPDGLNSARQWYVAALDLLGERPDLGYTSRWEPRPLAEVAGGTSQRLRALEAKHPELPLLPVVHDWTLRAADTDAFRPALNTQLLAYWNSLESRLFNLRHNLTLDGKPLVLPLFAPQANPRELLAARSRGAGSGGGGAAGALTIPPYRFLVMQNKALQAVETLIQYGSTLLGLLERKDAKDIEQLQLSQQLDLLDFTLTLQQQAIEMTRASVEGLRLGKAGAQARRDHYRKLFDEPVSSTESQAMDLRTTAGALNIAAQPLMIAGGLASLAPNIFGVAVGGSQWGAPLAGVGAGLQAIGMATEMAAQRLDTSEQYRRRRSDWEIQYQQAEHEIAQLEQQIAAQALQEQSAQTQLQQVEAQQAQLQAMLAFLDTRFTGPALYPWLIGQLSALYFQAYDAVVSLCLAAEAAWQYEMGEFGSRFIQGGGWSDLYKGLLAGETLKLALQRMDQAYLTRNERRLEVVKTVSLKALKDREPDGWNQALASLQANGTLDFALSERDYDQDYPGHYLRQIASVSVSLPAVSAPYQDVRAELTQTSSHVLSAADIEGVKWLLKPEGSAGDNVQSNLRASQQVALSTGVEDSGLFVLNFGDGRYLPFEGTGAVSTWQLSFPNPDDARQQALLSSLTDVIVRVRYTAKNGGRAFREAVQAAVQSPSRALPSPSRSR
ncbi:Tc toxin subunit A-related protein [Trinickia mobilis]|uniref:Tc toxin subunit A-related protein n=1 Tax=Trinickia mobilis TaxID=2816356 RepID=UPI001F5DD7F9|nr:hypothetical protein [Trinickia mobilis]